MSNEQPPVSKVVRSSATKSPVASTYCSSVPADEVRLSCDVCRIQLKGVPGVRRGYEAASCCTLIDADLVLTSRAGRLCLVASVIASSPDFEETGRAGKLTLLCAGAYPSLRVCKRDSRVRASRARCTSGFNLSSTRFCARTKSAKGEMASRQATSSVLAFKCERAIRIFQTFV